MILTSKIYQYKGIGLTSFLLALTLFSGIALSVMHWSANHRKSAVEIYQFSQAIQIAENQKQRQFLGLECEKQVHQNNLIFLIECGEKHISVRYPMGKITL
ncbi:TPA: DUF5374 domain-containing protein [Pasteurella multocida]|nr:DUF5374 domain-containing protein [Pasteurella multocida]